LDDGQVMAPEVLHDGRRYWMWYTGMSRARAPSGMGYYRIFLATSADGVVWRRENGGAPVLDVGFPGSLDEVQVATPSTVKERDGYRMWYAAWSPSHSHTICAASSHDGVHWKRDHDGRPVEGLCLWEAYGPAVCRYGDRYLMLFMALRGEPGLYGAFSDDGIHWRMAGGGKPVLSPGKADDFDGSRTGHAFLSPQPDRIRLWYTGYPRADGGVSSWLLRLGLAEIEFPAPVAR